MSISQTSFNVPSPEMEREFKRKTLGEMFETDEENNPVNFDYRKRNNSNLLYNIPEHQRYPQWNKEQKQKLIDTVFRNYPMSGFVVSEHIEDKNKRYDFEDGQTRLSVLQQYFMDEFSYTYNNHEIFYSNLSMQSKRRFTNYYINLEVLANIKDPDVVHDVFDRLQNGTVLKKPDLYWNRKEYSYVKKAMDIVKTPIWLDKYMNTNSGISDKHRSALPSVVTLIYSIIHFNEVREQKQESMRKTMCEDYRAQALNLNNPIKKSDEKRIETFLEYINHIITEVYRIFPPEHRETVCHWGKLGKQTSMILLEWLEWEKQGNQSINRINQKKWIELMNIERRSGNFMFKGEKTMWNNMISTEKQNMDDASVSARLKRVTAFYTNMVNTSKEHSIKFNDESE